MSLVLNVVHGGDDLIIDELEEWARDVFHQTMEQVFVNVVETTPVDTGTARMSWDIATDESDLKETPYRNYGLRRRGIPRYPKNADHIVVGTKNDYMVFLNEGHSQQAPSLFIERAVDDALDAIF